MHQLERDVREVDDAGVIDGVALVAEEDVVASGEGVAVELDRPVTEGSDLGDADALVNGGAEGLGVAESASDPKGLVDVGLDHRGGGRRGDAPVGGATA